MADKAFLGQLQTAAISQQKTHIVLLALFAGAGDLTLAAYQANAENKAAGINVQFHVLACYYRESVSVVAQTRLKLKAWEDYNNCSFILEGHAPLAKMHHRVAHFPTLELA